jgi:hypothetical protein
VEVVEIRPGVSEKSARLGIMGERRQVTLGQQTPGEMVGEKIDAEHPVVHGVQAVVQEKAMVNASSRPVVRVRALAFNLSFDLPLVWLFLMRVTGTKKRKAYPI